MVLSEGLDVGGGCRKTRDKCIEYTELAKFKLLCDGKK